ncbi:MAG: SDR family oxidoreductase [Abditibacteriaceae bacterium]
MAIDLTGKVCVLTGCGQGIGEALARGFVARGAIVVATSRHTPDVAEAALNLAWEVSDENRAEEVMREVVERFGRVDSFIANAALMPRENWNELSPQSWREVLAANLDGAWWGAQAAARQMTAQKNGKIVFISSIEVELGVAVHVHYDASKAALIGLTRSLARAVGADGVRVNCVMVGAIQTTSELRQFPDQDAVRRWCDERQCVPGRLQSEDMVPTFAFLCSSESDAITGQVICADNGLVHY